MTLIHSPHFHDWSPCLQRVFASVSFSLPPFCRSIQRPASLTYGITDQDSSTRQMSTQKMERYNLGEMSVRSLKIDQKKPNWKGRPLNFQTESFSLSICLKNRANSSREFSIHSSGNIGPKSVNLLVSLPGISIRAMLIQFHRETTLALSPEIGRRWRQILLIIAFSSIRTV
jgi:hypothetical protein